MDDERNIKYGLRGETDSGLGFYIEAGVAGQTELIEGYLFLSEMAEAAELVLAFRDFCERTESGYFRPPQSMGNQMTTLCVTAAASFPKTLTRQFLESELEIPFNSYKVYATANQYESSRYLTLRQNGDIEISIAGIRWAQQFLL